MTTATTPIPSQETHAEASEPRAPVLGLVPGSVTYALFKHMAEEHGLTLLESEMSEIVRIVNDNLEARLRWWITNAEGIARDRATIANALRALMARSEMTEGQAFYDRVRPEWCAAEAALTDCLPNYEF